MRILGIESSCDDCAAAVLEDGSRILSHVLHSQIETHRPFGGVVPELASRNHLEKIVPVVDAALEKAGTSWSGLDGVAVTRGPGLVGSLLVGLCAAKAIAFVLNVPLCGVNHLEGHLLASFLEDPAPRFPFIGLIVSGGHTSLYEVTGFGRYRLLGQTRDDAAGEAFDKTAKLLGLGYPGGIVIDRLAADGDPLSFSFPRALASPDTLDFSFSGLKTSVLYFVRRQGEAFVRQHLSDIAASFQEAVVQTLLTKLSQAIERTGIRRAVLSGGVACNSRLRSRLLEMGSREGVPIHIPSPFLCSDNAAMIAAAGYRHLLEGRSAPLTLNVDADLSL
ncbi:MAG: tRNA (adenosine(37)-N6)-threonylcarbamoyltransferase complex transferase subunit TsaD [bacterium]